MHFRSASRTLVRARMSPFAKRRGRTATLHRELAMVDIVFIAVYFVIMTVMFLWVYFR